MPETGYGSIAGYNDIKTRLKNAVQKDRVSHAYIFSGEEGSGKTTMATAFAAALLCEKHTGDACMQCASCRRVQSRNHPDIRLVVHRRPESIGVDDIRKQIVDDICIKPFSGGRKIYMIPEASLMTTQAQNALLKMLEEPPAYAVIILLAENTDGLIPTVISRCTAVRFGQLDDEVVREYLENELMIPNAAAQMYAALAMGKVGAAKRLALSEDFAARLNEAIRYLKISKDVDPIDRIEATKKFAADKKEIYDYLDIFTVWFRDVLVFKATKAKEDVIIKDELSAIKRRASLSSYEGIQDIIDAIDNAHKRLRANVNPELVLELLLLKISEN